MRAEENFGQIKFINVSIIILLWGYDLHIFQFQFSSHFMACQGIDDHVNIPWRTGHEGISNSSYYTIVSMINLCICMKFLIFKAFILYTKLRKQMWLIPESLNYFSINYFAIKMHKLKIKSHSWWIQSVSSEDTNVQSNVFRTYRTTDKNPRMARHCLIVS